MHLWYFNSIKVRLEQREKISVSPIKKFQFHKGTIRTTDTARIRQSLRYFNSIKVRLEPVKSWA